MKWLRCSLIAAAMFVVLMVPSVVCAETVTPAGEYKTGDIIEPLVKSNDTVYYKVNDCLSDILFSVMDDGTFEFTLGKIDSNGEFVAFENPKVMDYEDSPEEMDLHTYSVRYDDIFDDSIGGTISCYIKATNTTSEAASFRAIVTDIYEEETPLKLGYRVKQEYLGVETRVLSYTPVDDKSANCVFLFENPDNDYLQDYFIVDEDGNVAASADDEGNPMYIGTIDMESYDTMTLEKGKNYKIYIYPSLLCPADDTFDKMEYPVGVIPDNIKYYTIGGLKPLVYNGKAKRPVLTAKYGNVTLKQANEDFGVRYSNNVNAGTATAKVTGYICGGTVTKHFTIKKAANKMVVGAVCKTYKYSKVKKSAKTFKAITVKNNKGPVSFSLKYANSKSKKALKFNKKNGKITVKKKTKKGTYKVTVTTTAKGTSNYNKKSVKHTITVKIK